MHTVSELLGEQPWPLARYVVPTLSFAVGNMDQQFELEASGPGWFAHRLYGGVLRLRTQIRMLDSALVITRRLENVGLDPSEPLWRIDPLTLVFSLPSHVWRHTYARGGTADAEYPPPAYQIRERSGCRGAIKIESGCDGRSSNE